MDKKRRNFIKKLPFSMLLPGYILNSFSSELLSMSSIPDFPKSDYQNKNIEELYKKAMVIDGLVIPRGWNEDSFKALLESGYTGFGASLSSGNLEVALKALADWHKRIEDNSDKLIYAQTKADFIRAKEENKSAILMGFQNGTMIEKSIDNINIRRRYMNAFKQLQEPVILDLRFCTGGDANTSFYILCHFFRDGIEMFEMMRRNVEPNIFISASVNTNYDELNVINKYYGKLKVLVNGYSYSASEIIAKTLQVHKRAKVYGSKTPGVTNTCHHVPIEPLMIQMPIAIYVDSITKKPFENIGVFPDYDVTSDEYIKTIYDEVAPNTFKSY
jgi:hypothetical protein